MKKISKIMMITAGAVATAGICLGILGTILGGSLIDMARRGGFDLYFDRNGAHSWDDATKVSQERSYDVEDVKDINISVGAYSFEYKVSKEVLEI